MPTHSQTYREYKEALRQQRGNVYKYRDNSHTPSPDTPPLSAYPSVDLPDRSLLNLNSAAATEHKAADVQTNAKDPSVFPYVKPSPPLPAMSTPPPPPPILLTRQPSGDPVISTSYRTMATDLGITSFSKLLIKIQSIHPFFFLFSTAAATIESNNPLAYRSPSVSAISGRISGTNRLSRNNSQTSKFPGSPVPATISPPPPPPHHHHPLHPPVSNNNGHMTPTHSNPPTHSIATASFTVRREMERHREEMEQIQQLRQVIINMIIPFLSQNFSSLDLF